MKDQDYLPDRWRRIIQRHARGEDFRLAARAEGCSEAYARVIRTRMMKNSAAARYLASIQAEARSVAVYGVVEAMAQAQKGIDLAERHKNPMAFITGCELRAKLSGLLIDRVEVVTVDLKGSLEAAKTRVLTAIDSTPLSSDGVLAGSVRWAPRVPGAQVVDNLEAGPADRESVRQVNTVGSENR